MHLKKAVIDHPRFPTTEAYPFNLPIIHQTDTITSDTTISGTTNLCFAGCPCLAAPRGI